jgi:hypothetical protein
MGVCKRQALRRLIRRDQAVGGRLLRSMGEKRMPHGTQASKYEVSLHVFHEVMRPDETTALCLETMRLELVVVRQQLESIRRAVRPLQRAIEHWNGTQRDMRNT